MQPFDVTLISNRRMASRVDRDIEEAVSASQFFSPTRYCEFVASFSVEPVHHRACSMRPEELNLRPP
jgi:hypothetical protein